MLYIKHAPGVPKRPIDWTHKTIYVDITTGEELTKFQSKKYIKDGTEEHIQLNWNKTRGIIERTVRCRPKPQLRIFD